MDTSTPDTLLALAIAYIDEKIALRRAEHDDLVRQLRWLEHEKQQLIEDAAQEMRRQADGR